MILFNVITNTIIAFNIANFFNTMIKVMYDDKAVCSARWHGVKGLGTELVRW